MTKLSNESEQIVIKTRRRVIGIECDVCGRLITPTSYCMDRSRYFRVTTGHHDWGNDSCESIKHLDICPNCICDFVDKYIKEIDGTEYLEMRTEYITEGKYKYD